VRGFLRWGFAGLLATVVWAAWWVTHELALPPEPIDLAIAPGTTPRAIAQAAVDAGLDTSPLLLYGWFRLSGQARAIKAGSYQLSAPLSAYHLLRMLVRGDENLESVTLVEGWTLRQMLAALAKEQHLAQTLRRLDAKLIMKKLGRPGIVAEGHFFPDTYTYAKGSSDAALLARALKAMDAQLAHAWAARAPQLPLQNPEQLLTLASIVEKETGLASDRPLVAAVFVNRLRAGMPLQTDPTVIYGLGERFDGNLRKRDLLADTPWNTYTRSGLPPTPIANPGRAALLAAAQPANTPVLYFVARGNGSSQFSTTLQEHNRAVNRYQRGQP
jgi:UPF0755 protein